MEDDAKEANGTATMATATSSVTSTARPPNRPAHDKFLEETTAAIAALDTRRKFLQDRLMPLKEQLAAIKKEREDTNEDRNKVDTELASINKDVSLQSSFWHTSPSRWLPSR